MITTTDLQQLISTWTQRMSNNTQPQSYKEALSECIYDLNQTINHSIEEEINYQEYLQSWEADDYLSSMEAYEQAI